MKEKIYYTDPYLKIIRRLSKLSFCIFFGLFNLICQIPHVIGLCNRSDVFSWFKPEVLVSRMQLFYCFSFLLLFPIFLFGASQPSLERVIGGCILVADYGSLDLALSEGAPQYHERDVEMLVRDGLVGGVLFKGKWDLLRLKERIHALRNIAPRPILLALDMEWGAAMRCHGIEPLPKAGLIAREEGSRNRVREWSEEIARQAQSLGINLVLGPVADVNSNPLNPVIGVRSFGSNPHEVSTFVEESVQAYNSTGDISCCVKHFPGHGDTSLDSHYDLPFVHKSMAELSKCELMPFQRAIQSHVPCVMTAHVIYPQCDPLPASLSSFWLQEVLRNRLGFKGVIITDDLIMKALDSYGDIPERALRSMKAGCDLLIISHTVQPAIKRIASGILQGEGLTLQEVYQHHSRVQTLKRDCMSFKISTSSL